MAACGGAVEPTGGSTSGGSSIPAPTSPGAPGTAAPPSVGAPSPAPAPGGATAGWSATASGCANFTVYARHSSGRRFLVVTANRTELGLAGLGASVTVDLASKSAGPSTEVAVETFARTPMDVTYCNDIMVDPQIPSRAGASQGTATFTISGVGREGDAYAVTVTLRGVVVRDASGALEQVPDLTYTNVGVGWLPG
jgi:hypothetical protein